MAYNYTKKVYTVPFTNWTSGNKERHNIRLVVLKGGTKPDYGPDGYGNGTSHTFSEICDYLKTWGVFPSDILPASGGATRESVPEMKYNGVPRISCWAQTRTNNLSPWRPVADVKNWEVGKYTLDKSPYWENAQNQTGNYFMLEVLNVTNTQKEIQYKFWPAYTGGFNVIETFIMWLPDDFEQGLHQSDARTYTLTNASAGDANLYISHVAGYTTSSIALHIYMALVLGGDIDDYEGTNADPYEPGGTSGPGGGTGNFDISSDTIGVPPLPTLSAVATGLVSVFAPSVQQTKDLATYLWDVNVDWANVKKVISDPIQTILGFSILPYTPDKGADAVVKLGNMSTGVLMPPVTNQYTEIDCGELNIKEFWGSYLDYSPYTKIQLYLPFIGIVPIDIDDVMNKTLKVVYHCDCLSGACVAYVLSNGSQIATYNGQVSANIPLSSNDFSNTVNGILGLAGNVGSLVMSGGAAAPAAVPGMAANAINALKPNVQKSGALSGTGGLMGTQYPFLIAQRPRQCVPANFNEYGGYPSMITAPLSSLEGYTKVSEIHLAIPDATEAEREEIEALLKEGVII